MEEMRDLFDEKGNPTGITIHRGEEIPEGMYYAVVDIWIVNSKGELLLQLRDPNKRSWPGLWCSAAGGGMQSGEDPDTACVREAQEEIGFTPDFTRGGKAFVYVGAPRLHHVYLFCQDVPLESLTLQKGEVVDVMYADVDTVHSMYHGGKMIPIDCTLQLLRMLPVLTSIYRKAD